MFVGKWEPREVPRSNAVRGKHRMHWESKRRNIKAKALEAYKALFCIKLSMSVCPDLAFSPLPSHVRVMLQVSMKSIDRSTVREILSAPKIHTAR